MCLNGFSVKFFILSERFYDFMNLEIDFDGLIKINDFMNLEIDFDGLIMSFKLTI